MSSPDDVPGPKPATLDSLAELLKFSGERRTASAQARERAHAAAFQSWRRVVDAHRAGARRRLMKVGLTTASAAALAIVSLWVAVNTPSSMAAVATVAALEGRVNVTGKCGTNHELLVRDSLGAGCIVRTSAGRLALTLGASSVRMNERSTLQLLDAETIALKEGEIYIDSGVSQSRSRLRILTPAGQVTHLGTQFRVLVAGSQTRIAVREGRVQLDANGGRVIRIGEREGLSVLADEMKTQSGLATDSPEWRWVSSIAPPFSMDGRTLHELLRWITREHGWRLQFASTEDEELTRKTRLHGGDVSTLPAEQILSQLSSITGIPLVVEGGVLRVSGVAQ